MTGSKRSLQGSTPYSLWNSNKVLTTAGTPTEAPPIAASKNFFGFLFESRNIFSLIALGAFSLPSKLMTLLLELLWKVIKIPPPSPDDCGSTNPSAIWIATVASIAFPPFLKIWMPIFVA